MWAYLLYCCEGVLIGLLLQLFKLYDWEWGVERLWFLVAVVSLTLAFATLNRRISAAADGRIARIASRAAFFIALALLLRVAFGTISEVRRTNFIQLDQGQLNYRASVWLLRGMNPYAKDNLLDQDVFHKLAPHLGRARGVDADFIKRQFDDYWFSMDLSKKEPLLRHLRSPEGRRAAPKIENFLAYRYGPVMLLTYAPFACVFGPAGIYICHLAALAIVLVSMHALMSYSDDPPLSFPFCYAAFFFLISPHLAWNIFILSANDLVALVYAFSAYWLLVRGNCRAGGFMLGLALGVKLLPAAFFLPFLFLSRDRRGAFLWFAAGITAWNLPFVLISPVTFFSNYYLFNLIRPYDSTAFIYFLPHAWQIMLKFAVGPLLLALILYLFIGRRAISPWGFLFLAQSVVLATSPIFHNNYLVWFVPVLYIYLAFTMRPAGFSDPRCRRPGGETYHEA